ncbi:CLUMA_CG002724, isoform A [Clunio marinus]|uniref:CLUMA_CG002724, isoform A n=1 Tax=Clunio marinus TaxID=568069 RepID=A0A1J1HNP6_9DIPT|nr:CLUMA_CG002724, isoform A [Clunio marinus]
MSLVSAPVDICKCTKKYPLMSRTLSLKIDFAKASWELKRQNISRCQYELYLRRRILEKEMSRALYYTLIDISFVKPLEIAELHKPIISVSLGEAQEFE